MKLIDLDEGYSKVEMRFTPDMENIFGMADGGAIFALIDEAFQTACNAYGTVAVALNVQVTYVAPSDLRQPLNGRGQRINRTNKVAHYDIKVKDDQGKLIASCQALAYRKGTPLPFLENQK